MDCHSPASTPTVQCLAPILTLVGLEWGMLAWIVEVAEWKIPGLGEEVEVQVQVGVEAVEGGKLESPIQTTCSLLGGKNDMFLGDWWFSLCTSVRCSLVPLLGEWGSL